MNRILFLLLPIIFLFQGVEAQILENLNGQNKLTRKNSWMGMEKQMDFQVDLSTYPLADLALSVTQECTTFIDGKLWFVAEKDTSILVSISSLAQEFGKKPIKLTLIGGGLNAEKVSVQKILNQVKSSSEQKLAQSDLVPVSRKKYISEFSDFYFVSLFVILFLIALYKLIYPYLLGVMLQPLSVINAEDFSDSGSLQKFFSFDIQFYLFIVSMMIAQVVLTVGIIFKFEQVSQLVSTDFIGFLRAWIILSLIVLVLTSVKFIGIRVVSYFFDLGKTDFAHFFYLLRMLVFSVSFLTILTAFWLVNDFSFLQDNYWVMVSGMFWIYLAAVFGLFLIMMNRLSFKKYHLFTYLCIAELVPFLILSKWILVLVL